MSYELYKEYVAENPECYEDSLKLEKEMRELKVKWESIFEREFSLAKIPPLYYNEEKHCFERKFS